MPTAHPNSQSGSQPIHPHSPRLILLLLGSLCVVTPFAVDMYLPAFATIAREFGHSTSQISFSLSTYFIGFAMGQMLYGPLLDRFGRKRPLYVGLTAYVLCSLGCALAPDLRSLVALRFLEALGGCVAQVGAIAMVRDFFPVKESAKVFSLLFLMIGTSPLLAPTIGSAIVAGLGWRWIFGVLATMAFIILMLVWLMLPEGHQPDHSVILRPGPIIAGFWSIFRNPQFLAYTFAGAFSFAGLLGFVSGSPILFMDGFHITSSTFGIVFAVLVLGFIGGNQANVILLRHYTSQQLFQWALVAQTTIGALLFAGTLAHALGMYSMMALFFAFLSCIGLTYPNGAALALAPFHRDAGRASALLGFLQTGTGAAISMAIGFLGVRAVIALLSGTSATALIMLFASKPFLGKPIEADATDAIVIH